MAFLAIKKFVQSKEDADEGSKYIYINTDYIRTMRELEFDVGSYCYVQPSKEKTINERIDDLHENMRKNEEFEEKIEWLKKYGVKISEGKDGKIIAHAAQIELYGEPYRTILTTASAGAICYAIEQGKHYVE